VKILVNDNVFNCKVAANSESIQKGMMGKKFDSNFDGMLFMMPDKKNQTFWMYDCLIPLDIIMIDGNVITKINHNCPPCDDQENCEMFEGFGNIVLELDGGSCKELGIKEGDRIKTSLF
jgi:uncharacterized membrane protein (UPF0127 family)